MFRSSKGSVLTWAACRGEMSPRDLGAYACPPQPPPVPSGPSSFILYFSTPLGMPHLHPFFFPFLPLSFLFSKKKKIISFLAFIFLALLCPPCPPPSPSLLCPLQSLGHSLHESRLLQASSFQHLLWINYTEQHHYQLQIEWVQAIHSPWQSFHGKYRTTSQTCLISSL